MIAWATDPRAELTMVASAVAMNNALPRPHSARQPTIPSTVSDRPARPAPAMVNNSDTCDGDAFRLSAIGLRMGSTRPIPMNATTDAKATAQTALGWRHILCGYSFSVVTWWGWGRP